MVGFSSENGNINYSEEVIAKLLDYPQWNVME